MGCSHLINDGVEESPPSLPLQNSEISQELFANLDGANVEFNNWHPVAVSGSGKTLVGQSGMGGLWEWTSTPLEEHEGFEPMKLYPAYTGTSLYKLPS
jgi:formylglycine-generating enzyme required for sulfatase activity